MNINERINRIVQMEQYLDTLKKAFFWKIPLLLQTMRNSMTCYIR